MSDETNTGQSTGNSDPLLGTAGTDQDPNKGTDTPTWFWTPEIRGEGVKPEYLLDKYTTVEDQAKAYPELQKRLGAFVGAPKEGYNFDFIDNANKEISAKIGDETLNVIDKESPTFTKLVETAKSLNMSQDAMQGLLSLYIEDLQARIPNPAEEMKKLGDNGQEQINILSQWAQNNLSADEVKTFNSMITTADSAKLFMKLREMTKEQPIPKNTGATSAHTIESVQREISENYDEYLKQGDFYKQKQAQLKEIIDREDV